MTTEINKISTIIILIVVLVAVVVVIIIIINNIINIQSTSIIVYWTMRQRIALFRSITTTPIQVTVPQKK